MCRLLIACGFCCGRARALVGFSSCSWWAPGLQSRGSAVVVHELSCSVAGGIFLDRGLNPCLLGCRWIPQGSPVFPLVIKQCILSFQVVQKKKKTNKQVSELSTASSCPSTEAPSGQGILPVLFITGSPEPVFITPFDIFLFMEVSFQR